MVDQIGAMLCLPAAPRLDLAMNGRIVRCSCQSAATSYIEAARLTHVDGDIAGIYGPLFLVLPLSYLYGVRQVSAMDERNAQLDREKSALADLLAAKKREYDQMRQHYRDRVSDLEDEVQRLKSEKLRLVDKLQLPESERASLVAQVNTFIIAARCYA